MTINIENLKTKQLYMYPHPITILQHFQNLEKLKDEEKFIMFYKEFSYLCKQLDEFRSTYSSKISEFKTCTYNPFDYDEYNPTRWFNFNNSYKDRETELNINEFLSLVDSYHETKAKKQKEIYKTYAKQLMEKIFDSLKINIETLLNFIKATSEEQNIRRMFNLDSNVIVDTDNNYFYYYDKEENKIYLKEYKLFVKSEYQNLPYISLYELRSSIISEENAKSFAHQYPEVTREYFAHILIVN